MITREEAGAFIRPAAVCAASFALLGGSLLAIEHEGTDTENSAACLQPSATDMHAVERLLHGPSVDDDKGKSLTKFDRQQAEAARQNGITLPSRRLPDQMTNASPHRPLKYFLRTTRQVLGEQGIDVTVARPGQLTEGNRMVPTRHDLHASSVKMELTNVVAGFARLPEDYVALSGLKHLVLARDANNHRYAAIALTGGVNDTVAVNVETNIEPAEISHELWHLINTDMCGLNSDAAEADPAFRAMNPRHFRYGEPQKPSRFDYEDMQEALQQIEAAAAQAPSPAVRREIRAAAQQKAKHIVSATRYGLTSVMEDQADLAQAFATPSLMGEYTDPDMPIVRHKFMLMLARLYDMDPSLATYFIRVGSHPSDDMAKSAGQ